MRARACAVILHPVAQASTALCKCADNAAAPQSFAGAPTFVYCLSASANDCWVLHDVCLRNAGTVSTVNWHLLQLVDKVAEAQMNERSQRRGSVVFRSSVRDTVKALTLEGGHASSDAARVTADKLREVRAGLHGSCGSSGRCRVHSSSLTPRSASTQSQHAYGGAPPAPHSFVHGCRPSERSGEHCVRT